MKLLQEGGTVIKLWIGVMKCLNAGPRYRFQVWELRPEDIREFQKPAAGQIIVQTGCSLDPVCAAIKRVILDGQADEGAVRRQDFARDILCIAELLARRSSEIRPRQLSTLLFERSNMFKHRILDRTIKPDGMRVLRVHNLRIFRMNGIVLPLILQIVFLRYEAPLSWLIALHR